MISECYTVVNVTVTYRNPLDETIALRIYIYTSFQIWFGRIDVYIPSAYEGQNLGAMRMGGVEDVYWGIFSRRSHAAGGLF